MTGTTVLRDDEVQLPSGPRLAVRVAPGHARPFLLVHGLASNARLWDGVAIRLAAAGHEVVAVDLRGHGRSEQTPDGYTTDQCADDLAELCTVLGLTDDRAPVVAGQSWGGNVAVSLAARRGGVGALALVDGGWIQLGSRFATFEECWAVLAPPAFDGMAYDDLVLRVQQWHPGWPQEGIAGALANFARDADGTARPRLSREHHRAILHSLWQDDPRLLYPRVRVPVLLLPAFGPAADHPSAAALTEAVELLARPRVAWYDGAHHDLHAEQPERLVGDLLALASRVGGRQS